MSYASGTTPVALVAGSFNATGQTDLAVVNYQNGTVGIYLALLGSTTSLSVSPNPDPAGVPVTFTATVTPSAATGTVTFMDGVNTEGMATLVNGSASLVATPVAMQRVTLSATPNPSTLNQVVTLTAAISNVSATGLVTFYNGSTVLGSGVVSAGGTQLLTAALPAGSLQLYARYDGDVNDAAAISVALPFSVAAGHGFGLGNAISFAAGTNPVSLAAADFNLDSRIDLAVADSVGNSVSVLLGDGDGTFAPGVTLPVGTTPTQVVTTDFNGDGKPDIAVTNSGSNNVSVFTGNGDGTFSAGINYAAGTAPTAVAVADFNNDGKADLIVANGSGGSISFIYGNGDGTLGTVATIPVGVTNSAIAAGDFNGDGNTDVAVTDTNTGVVWILLGNGNGTFQAPVSYKAGTTPVRGLSRWPWAILTVTAFSIWRPPIREVMSRF